MLEHIQNEEILFLDIETVPFYESYDLMPETFQEFWEKKSNHFRKSEESAKDVYQRAGIYSEFGKIICISVGFIYNKDGEKFFRIKSFYGEDEKEVLTGFSDLLNALSKEKNPYLCAHNGKEFDFPYIARRLLINELPLLKVLDVSGKKPWEVPFLDTLELWKFGDYKHYTSLNQLCYLFNIATPKDDIDGSMVADVFWKEKNIERIVTYCEKDVVSVAQLFLKYRGEEIIIPENIELVKP